MTINRRLRISFVAACLLISSTACVQEQELVSNNQKLHEAVFHAGWDTETKTVLQEDGSIFWSSGDEISLFVGEGYGGGYKLTATNAEPASKTDFVGQIGDKPSGVSYVAVYPYNETNWVSDNKVHYEIPSVQIAEEGFDPKAFISIACSENESLYFKNVCSGIKFSVKTPGIKKIEISTESGLLSGEFTYMLGTEEISFWNPSRKATIVSPTESGFEVDKYYYIALNPTICRDGIEDGVIVSYFTKDKVARFKYDQSIEFKRGVLKRLYDKDADLVFSNYYEAPATIYKVLPESFDKNSVSEVFFHVKSDKTTDYVVSSDGSPVYAELQNGTLNLYTSGDVYDITDAAYMMFKDWRSLKYVDTSHWDASRCENMSEMFQGCLSLESIDLSTFDTHCVKDMSFMFSGCSSLTSLDLSSFNTEKVTNMRWMFGGFTTEGCSSLEALDLSTFDTSNVSDITSMFNNCGKLKSVNLDSWDISNVESLNSLFNNCTSLKQANLSSFDTSNVKDMQLMFNNCTNLESIDLSGFNTSHVTTMNSMFYMCTSLKSVDISSFTSESLSNASTMFAGCFKMKKMDFGTFDISSVGEVGNALYYTAQYSKNCAIRCTESMKQTILDKDTWIEPTYITWVQPGEAIPELNDYRDPNLYYSSDFSKDGEYELLNTSSKGKGVDIVLMGDAYSDRLIEDGTYKRDMEDALEAIFSLEPYASFRDMFNVYMVYVVSENEVFSGNIALRSGMNGDVGNYGTINNYALSCVKNKELSDIAIVVIGHDSHCLEETGADGLTMCFYNDDVTLTADYGQAQQAIAFIPRYEGEQFGSTVSHEFGHCFAKLGDEYSIHDEYISEGEKYLLNHYRSGGVFKNLDLTSDVESVKWSIFLTDSRYANEGLGVFEGGQTFSKGVWRPSEMSLMNMQNKLGFNAPSREAIYYRIHKLAYGKDWQYDYETFVQQDLKNIPSTVTNAAPAKYVPYPATVNKKPFFKMEESTTPEGKRKVTVIMD